MPVAFVYARDQPRAHVTREVEIDVRQRRDLLVQEAAEEELVGDRVDVREPSQVTDDRRDRRAAPAAWRQQRAHGVRPAHLGGDLARQLQQVTVQQEETRKPEMRDQRQLLLQAAGCLITQEMTLRVAMLETGVTGPGEISVGVIVLGSRIAIAEILGQVEGQGRGEPCCLGRGIGVVLEARLHRLRRGEYVGVVTAAQRLR